MSEAAIDIRALRESVKWSQGRLARYLGCDRTSISHYENGRELSGPVLRLLKILASAAANGTADALCPEDEAVAAAVEAAE